MKNHSFLVIQTPLRQKGISNLPGSELHITNENAQVIELNCDGKNTYCILTRNGAYSVFWSDDIYLYKMRFEGKFSIAEIEMIVSSVKN